MADPAPSAADRRYGGSDLGPGMAGSRAVAQSYLDVHKQLDADEYVNARPSDQMKKAAAVNAQKAAMRKNYPQMGSAFDKIDAR